MADAADLNSAVREDVRVRIPSPAPVIELDYDECAIFTAPTTVT